MILKYVFPSEPLRTKKNNPLILNRIGLLLFTSLCCTLSNASLALTIDETRHLLSRAGFAPAPHEFKAFETLSREAAVRKIIGDIRQTPVTPPPSLMFEQFYDLNPLEPAVVDGCALPTEVQKNMTPPELYPRRYAEHYAMKRWWWTEMINTPSPLTERLTLMWHDHFSTKFMVWAIPQYYNNQTLRSLGATDFKSLAISMLRDPAMIYFLDNYKNVVQHPNENLAREFLELFTMGEGNYSEDDIKELAKVLAGHGISENHCQYVFNKDQAYDGEVTLLGKTGKFTLEQAVDVIFQSPKVSEFIVKRFWTEFISPEYTEEQIQPLAVDFRQHNYNIKHLLEKVLLRDEFWRESNRGSLIKSPVELLVGMVRSLGVWMPDPDLLMADSSVLGQDLFFPPNVAGWPQNDEWITPLTVVLRSVAMDRVWNAANNFNALRSSNRNLDQGLMIRVSSQQYPGQEARQFDLYVNDKFIKHYTLNLSDREDKKVAMGVVQEPETLYIPASELPETVNTVKIQYTVDTKKYKPAELPLLAVHWIAYENRRYNINLAKQVFTDTSIASGDIPFGMLYYNGSLSFDLTKIRQKYQKTARDGREFMAYNTITPLISEMYSFGHEQPLPLTPAGLSYNDLGRDLVGSFKALADKIPATEKNTLIDGIPMLAVLPKPSQLTAADLADTNVLQALLQSPYYQHK